MKMQKAKRISDAIISDREEIWRLTEKKSVPDLEKFIYPNVAASVSAAVAGIMASSPNMMISWNGDIPVL